MKADATSTTESVPTAPDFAAPARAAIQAVLPLVVARGRDLAEIRGEDRDALYDETIAALHPILGRATLQGAWLLSRQIAAYCDAMLREGWPAKDAAGVAVYSIEEFIAKAYATGPADVLARVAFLRHELEIATSEDEIVKWALHRLFSDVEVLVAGKPFEPHSHPLSCDMNSYFAEWQLCRIPPTTS